MSRAKRQREKRKGFKTTHGLEFDVLEWFEHSAKRDRRALRIRELMNDRFRDHLISKRGFVLETEKDVIKHPG